MYASVEMQALPWQAPEGACYQPIAIVNSPWHLSRMARTETGARPACFLGRG